MRETYREIPKVTERLSAVLGTLMTNRRAEIDGFLGGIGAIGPFVLNDPTKVAPGGPNWEIDLIIGIPLGIAGIIARGAVKQGDHEFIETSGDYAGRTRSTEYDRRTIIGFVIDSWKTGQVQHGGEKKS